MKDIQYHFRNLAKHHIDSLEAQEALYDGWAVRRRVGENYEVLGRTVAGRYLQLVVEEREDVLWVFHGRDMEDSERRRYHRK